MAGFEVASSPVVMEESLGKDVMERKEGKPDRPRREPEEVPDMTVEEAHKALNALSKAEPQPESEEHDQQVAAINEDIRKIKIQIEDLKTKIDKAQEGRQGQVDEMSEARETMRTLKLERDEIRSQLNSVQEVTKSAKATLEGHDKSKKALQSSLKYRTVEEIETAIKKMEIRQQTSSMSLSDEKKLVKEIEHLKQSKKTAAQYVSHEEALGKAKDGYNATRKTESEKKAELKIVQDKIRATHTVLEGMNKTREEEGAGVSKLYEEKKALHEEISEKIEEIKDIRRAHTARLDAWYDLRRERMKFKKAMQKAEWVERQAAKEARHKAIEDEEAKKIPFESEMVLCDNLVTYLETTFLKGEAAKPAAAAAPSPTGAAASAEFGGVKMVMKKRHEEDFIMGGGRRKSGGRKKAGGKNAPAARNTIVHAMDTMESFAMLSISPPPSKAAVPDAIKALKDKKAWFKEQPRPTPGKQTQSGEKIVKKQATKEKIKPPDINDAEFPGLPGMVIKPKQEDPLSAPGATENSGEEGDADGDLHEGATSDEKASEAEAPQSAASVVANGIHGKANGAEKNADDGKTASSAGQAEMKEDEDQQDGLEGEVDPTVKEKVEDCVQRGPEDGEDAPKAEVSGKEGDQVDAGEVVEGSAGTKDGDEE